MLLLRRRTKHLQCFVFLLTVFMLWGVIRILMNGLRPPGTPLPFNGRPAYSLWSPYNVDEMWLHNVKARGRGELPWVVVEEHYEVVKYWFQAANLGFLPKSKNTLIHIDSHVDGAVPYRVDRLPWFRFPRSDAEIQAMMQRNDMFITAAVLSGFINHVIWVYPTWDKDSHGPEKPHEVIDFQIGIFHEKHHQSDLCACWQIRDGQEGCTGQTCTKQKQQWECHRRNFTEIEVERGPVIPYESCAIQMDGVLETMREDVAGKELKKMKAPSQGLILDVDEDFFGVWSDIYTFNDSHVLESEVRVVSELVSDLWCGTTAQHEVHVDNLYTGLIHMVIGLKKQECPNDKDNCLSTEEISDMISDCIPIFMQSLSSYENGHLLCNIHGGANEEILQNLLSAFLYFNIKQLQVFAQIGVCFQFSPTSMSFPDSGKLHVCQGENTPSQSLIAFSLPDNSDVIDQTKSLMGIISSIPQRPNLATVCRSIRDGYTPKDYFRMIESAVMTAMTSTFRSADLKSIHFDGNLLGGPLGWRERPQSNGKEFSRLIYPKD